MSIARLIRLSGLAAIVGGVFIVFARVLQVIIFGSQPLSEQAGSPLFVPALGITGLLGSLGFSAGLIGLYLRQADRLGRVGLVVFILAFSGISLSMGANWAYAFAAPYIWTVEPGLLNVGFGDPAWGALGTGFLVSYLAGGLGWLLMGAVTLIAGVLPRWVGGLLVGSMILAAALPLGTNGPGGIVVNLLLAAGPIVFGWVLFVERNSEWDRTG